MKSLKMSGGMCQSMNGGCWNWSDLMVGDNASCLYFPRHEFIVGDGTLGGQCARLKPGEH